MVTPGMIGMCAPIELYIVFAEGPAIMSFRIGPSFQEPLDPVQIPHRCRVGQGCRHKASAQGDVAVWPDNKSPYSEDPQLVTWAFM